MTLRVKLEIIPYGDESRAHTIARMDISNQGHVSGVHAHHGDMCAYSVKTFTDQKLDAYSEPVYHRRSEGAWQLVMAAINQLRINGP